MPLNRIPKDGLHTVNFENLQIKYYYRACDVLVLPSLVEGFGLVFLEAWASGKPVIGTDIPIVKNDVMRDGIDGLICRKGDVNSLAEAIEKLKLNPELRKKWEKMVV